MSIYARMSIARLGVEADELGAGLITFRRDEDDHGWFCFASEARVPHVARGRTGKEAFAELLRFLRALR